MVKKSFIALTLLVLLVIGVFIARDFFTSEEARIRERFTEVASLISRDRDERPIAMLGLTRSLRTFFADPCSIEAPRGSVSGSYSPRELAGLAMRARQSFSDLSLSFHDLDITVRNGTADAVFTALLQATRNGERLRQVREVEAELEKAEGEWVFSRIVVVQVLRK